MDVPVARTAEVYGTVDLLPVERLLVALVLVARPGDEVVASEVYCRPSAELAGPLPRAVPVLYHRGSLASPVLRPCERHFGPRASLPESYRAGARASLRVRAPDENGLKNRLVQNLERMGCGGE